jgi:hypothetical protein
MARTRAHKPKTTAAEQEGHMTKPPGTAASGPRGSLLDLQRTAGNQAVSALLAWRDEVPDTRDAGQADQTAQRGLNTAGRPLDPATRARMEARFDQDFGQVRVHTSEQAEESAAAMQAKAYTVGQDIVFGRGRHAPSSNEGQRLLAHELAHVVQQRRGGAPAPNPYHHGPLEQAATRAAAQAATAGGIVAVEGSAGPGVMRHPDDKEERKRLRREREKQRTQRRKQERATAGKDPSQLSQEQAERKLRRLEESYKQPGAKSRSLNTKEQGLKSYKKSLKQAGGSQVRKNQRQGAFDELQRTPTTTSGKPQTKHVAGGPQLPGQELRPGEASYAQPDYSIVRRTSDGKFERVHVNLKSDQIDTRTPAKARSTARVYVEQAIRNSRHLAQGESIVISFAHRPTKDVQDAMNREFFKEGSPVSEVRYGTTTVNRKNYRPSGGAPPATKTRTRRKGKKPAAKATKATRTKTARAKITKPAVSATPAVKPSVIEPPKVAEPPVAKTPAVTTPKPTPTPTPEVVQPKPSTTARITGGAMRVAGPGLRVAGIVGSIGTIEQLRGAFAGLGPVVDLEGLSPGDFDVGHEIGGISLGTDEQGQSWYATVRVERNVIGRRKFYIVRVYTIA